MITVIEFVVDVCKNSTAFLFIGIRQGVLRFEKYFRLKCLILPFQASSAVGSSTNEFTPVSVA